MFVGASVVDVAVVDAELLDVFVMFAVVVPIFPVCVVMALIETDVEQVLVESDEVTTVPVKTVSLVIVFDVVVPFVAGETEPTP